jgi:hypothetical protein
MNYIFWRNLLAPRKIFPSSEFPDHGQGILVEMDACVMMTS